MTAAVVEGVAERTRPSDFEIRVSADSNPASVAGAIAAAIDRGQIPILRAIGTRSVNQAVRAVAIARGYVAPQGIDIATIPGLMSTTGEGDTPGSVVTLRVIQIR